MIKVFFLIFEPGPAWDKIARMRRGFAYIAFIQVLPLILLGTAAEAWGLRTFGKWQPQYSMHRNFSPTEVFNYESIQFMLLVAMVLVSAMLVFKISQTFQGQLTFLQVFTTVAYGYSPMFLFHVLDFAASMHPAVTWAIGLILTIWVLYQGIPRVMRPDPTHAFGVYLSSIFVVILVSGLARLMTAMYLLGYMDFEHSWLSRKLAHLLGH
jgi:hypothetical protein